jgi:hypothetical protein
MTLTIEQTDAAILSTFHSMEGGVDYVLNDHWFSEMNRVRKQYNYSILKDKKDYLLSRKGEKFLLNGKEVFDFKDKTNLTFSFSLSFAFAFAFADDDLACAFADDDCAFAFAFAFAFALQHNGIEKLNKDTCEGKVVEIGGKKYKLTAV